MAATYLSPGSGLEKQNEKLLRQRYQGIKDKWDCGDCAFVRFHNGLQGIFLAKKQNMEY